MQLPGHQVFFLRQWGTAEYDPEKFVPELGSYLGRRGLEGGVLLDAAMIVGGVLGVVWAFISVFMKSDDRKSTSTTTVVLQPTPVDDAEMKVCPFCAESIKAAAMKCRYCQSELA